MRSIRQRVAVALSVSLALIAVGVGGAGASGPASVAAPSSAATRSKPKATVVKGSGDITDTVDEYRELLGPDNGGGPETFASGRREINWDAVPDELAAPNAFPGDFFNAAEPPRARGAVLETDGDHVAVSADADNPAGVPPRFGDINPSYAETFETFSEERLFSPVGSNVATITFFVPGSDTEATVRGFGAVYADVDKKETAAFEYFDADGKSLGTFSVPKSKDGLSFLGVTFKKPIVAKVQIVYGNTELGPDDDARYDVAVMDDFIFGEPQAVND